MRDVTGLGFRWTSILGTAALGVVLYGAQMVEAQASPACLTTCETTAAKAAGCSGPTDNTCVCTSQPFLSAVDSCINKVCSEQDQPAALRALQQQCASFTASGPPATGSPSDTGTGTGTPPPQPITSIFTTVITSIFTPTGPGGGSPGGPPTSPSPSPVSPPGGLSTIPPPLSAPSVNPPSASSPSSLSSLTSPPILTPTPTPTTPTSESPLSTSTVTITSGSAGAGATGNAASSLRGASFFGGGVAFLTSLVGLLVGAGMLV